MHCYKNKYNEWNISPRNKSTQHICQNSEESTRNIYIETQTISKKTVERKLNIHKKKPDIRSVYAVLYQSQFKMDQNLYYDTCETTSRKLRENLKDTDTWNGFPDSTQMTQEKTLKN